MTKTEDEIRRLTQQKRKQHVVILDDTKMEMSVDVKSHLRTWYRKLNLEQKRRQNKEDKSDE